MNCHLIEMTGKSGSIWEAVNTKNSNDLISLDISVVDEQVICYFFLFPPSLVAFVFLLPFLLLFQGTYVSYPNALLFLLFPPLPLPSIVPSPLPFYSNISYYMLP